MAQPRRILDFSKKKKELNTIESDTCDEPIPDPLAGVLVRILQRTKCSSDSNPITVNQMKEQCSSIVKSTNS
jgi:hypothetical protein